MENQEQKLRTIKNKVEGESEKLDKLVDNIVAKYNKDLNVFITEIKSQLDSLKDGDEISDSDIENMVLRIPVFMYFTSSGLESLGIEGDNAKSIKNMAFSEKYMLAEGTVKDKESSASLQTLSEHMIEIAFTRAYKKLKLQIEMAEHIFSGVKKILSKRMQEQEMNRRDR